MSRTTFGIKTISLAVSSACAWMALPAYAQQAVTPPARAASAPAAKPADAPQAITVTGYRGAAESGLSIKRDAEGFVDAISADGLGRFPELNVGEALTRIPGIQLDRFSGDRDARVSLRGLPGGFAVVTVNGLGIADPNRDAGGGGTPLGMFSSDVFTTFLVNKSPSAADASGGLSGNIDLQFRGALARKDGGDVKISGEYNDLGKSSTPSATVRYNHHFSPDLAVFGVLVAKKEHFRRDTITMGTGSFQLYDGWTPTTNAADNGGTFANNVNAYTPALNNFAGSKRFLNIADFVDYYAPPPSATNKVLNGEQALYIPAGSTLGNTTDIVGTGKKSRNGIQALSQMQYQARESKGDNLSLSTGVEYRLNPQWRFQLTGLYADKNLKEATSEGITQNINFSRARYSVDPADVKIMESGNAYASALSVDNTQFQNVSSLQTSRNKADAVVASATYNDGPWRVVSNASRSTALGRGDTYALVLQTAPQNPFRRADLNAADGLFASNGTKAYINYGGGSLGNIRWDLQRQDPFTVPSGVLKTQNAGSASPIGGVAIRPQEFAIGTGTTSQITGSNSTGVLQPRIETQEVVNKVTGFQQQFERSLDPADGGLASVFASLKAGWRAEANDFKMTSYASSVYGINADGITNALTGAVSPYRDGFFGGAVGANKNWFGNPVLQGLAALKPTAASLVPGQALTPVGYPVVMTPEGWVSNWADNNVINNNFTNDYKIYSAFVMGHIDTEVFGSRIRGNVGLRHERTEKTIVAMDRVNTTFDGVRYTGYELNTSKKNYGFNLPSLLLATDLRRDLVLRYGYYETFVRPSRSQERPNSSATRTESVSETNYAIQLSSGKVAPYTAKSHDIALEWYNTKGSVIALGAYQKEVKGFIYTQNLANARDEMCPASGLFGGVDYGTGPLVYDAGANRCRAVNDARDNSLAQVDANGNPIPTATYVTASANANNPNTTRVTGFELNVQQNLSFLPAPWSNFGGSANFSYTKVTGTLPGGAPVPLTNAAKTNNNLVVYYDQGPFGIRLIRNSRAQYAQSSGDKSLNERQPGYYDTFVKPRTQFDLSTSWRFGEGGVIALDIYNLSNARVETWREDQSLVRTSFYDGRTATVTFRMPF